MDDREWRQRAACRGADVELFYSERHADIDRALSICACCEVRAVCYEQAMIGREAFGVWGGTEEGQRRRLFRMARRSRDASAPAA
ncbi:MAG: WhiB family transcriptional regulator [Egibacteraceae bacterium]